MKSKGLSLIQGPRLVILRKEVCKISMRFMPNMILEVIREQVSSYLLKKIAELQSPNKYKVYSGHGRKHCVASTIPITRLAKEPGRQLF